MRRAMAYRASTSRPRCVVVLAQRVRRLVRERPRGTSRTRCAGRGRRPSGCGWTHGGNVAASASRPGRVAVERDLVGVVGRGLEALDADQRVVVAAHREGAGAAAEDLHLAGLVGLHPHRRVVLADVAQEWSNHEPRGRHRPYTGKCGACTAASPDDPGGPERRGGPRRAARAPAHGRGGRGGRARPAPRPAATPTPTSGRASSTSSSARSRQADANLVACDDELLPAPGAQPGGGARRAGHRPHRDHPRHLRRPRPHGRGQAPGRAGPARVQPRPHARAVDAPRAPRRRAHRRRHRHPRPGRVPDRDRPPPGPRPHRRAAAPPAPRERHPRRHARRARARAPARDRAGRLHQRRQVDAAQRAHRAPRSACATACSTRWTRRRGRCDVDGRAYLLTDTVGFIRKLPHQLVDAFGATLEETRRADLILHVVDASRPRRSAWSR